MEWLKVNWLPVLVIGLVAISLASAAIVHFMFGWPHKQEEE